MQHVMNKISKCNAEVAELERQKLAIRDQMSKADRERFDFAELASRANSKAGSIIKSIGLLQTKYRKLETEFSSTLYKHGLSLVSLCDDWQNKATLFESAGVIIGCASELRALRNSDAGRYFPQWAHQNADKLYTWGVGLRAEKQSVLAGIRRHVAEMDSAIGFAQGAGIALRNGAVPTLERGRAVLVVLDAPERDEPKTAKSKRKK